MTMYNKPYKILIIDRDKHLLMHLKSELEKKEYLVDVLSDEKAIMTKSSPLDYNLIILDIDVVYVDGNHLCLWIKSNSNIPIIVLTRRHKNEQLFESFQAGADDCVVKPISSKEMMLRVQALLRRYTVLKLNQLTSSHYNSITLSHLVVETTSHNVFFDQKPVKLTLKEYELLSYMARHPNTVLTREHLLHVIWKQNSHEDYRTIDTHIKRLRDKLMKTSTLATGMIQTIRGTGYILRVSVK